MVIRWPNASDDRVNRPSLICRLGVIELNAFYRNAARVARGLALANTAVTVSVSPRGR